MNRNEELKYAFVSNIIEDADIRLTGFYPRLGRIVPFFIWRGRYVLNAFFGKG